MADRTSLGTSSAVPFRACCAVALILSSSLWSIAACQEPDRSLEVSQAIETIATLENRFQTCQFRVQTFRGKLADLNDSASFAQVPNDPSIQKTFAAFELASGRFRFDFEGIMPWTNGFAPFLSRTTSTAFDGKQVEEYDRQKHGIGIPQPKDDATSQATIDFRKSPQDQKTLVACSGLWNFPPFFLGERLSEFLNKKLRSRLPVTVMTHNDGTWSITAKDEPPIDGTLQIDFDPRKGQIVGATWSSGATGAPERYFRYQLQEVAHGTWAPRVIDDVFCGSKHAIRQVYSDVRLNQPLAEQLFHLTFPPGTRIVDRVAKKVYIAGQATKDDQKAIQDYKILYRLSPESTPSHSRAWIPYGLTVLNLVALTGVFWQIGRRLRMDLS
jgi:hypothetical protein